MTSQYSDPLRFGHLLLLLSMIKEVKTTTIKQLYFSSYTGNLPIEKFLTDIYRYEALPMF